MKILLTGGLGLLGRQIIQLYKTGRSKTNREATFSTLVVTDNLLYTNDFLDQSITFYGGDCGDPNFMKFLFNQYKFDVVIHLAGIVGDAACGYRPQEAKKANLTSLEILRDNFEGRLIWPSSCSVYGANDNLVDETSPLNPLSLYAEMKVQGEEILKDRPNTVILRLGTLHGLTERFRSDLVVHILTTRALIEHKMPVFGGDQYRPMLHVEDLAETIFYDLLYPTMFGKPDITGIFNLVENNYKIIDIAKIIQNKIQDAIIEITEMPFEDKRNYRASSLKALNTWGFTPRRKITETVQDIKKAFQDGRIKNFSSMKYSNISALKFGEK